MNKVVFGLIFLAACTQIITPVIPPYNNSCVTEKKGPLGEHWSSPKSAFNQYMISRTYGISQ